MIRAGPVRRRALPGKWLQRPREAALVLFAALALAYAAPILPRLNSAVLGGSQNDATLAARGYWADGVEHSSPFSQTRDVLNGSPEGAPLAPATQLVQPVQPGLIWALRDVTGIVAALNLYLIAGLILTPWSMFLLLHAARLSFWPCVAAGAIAGFNPWVIDRVNAGHIGFVEGWVIILTLWLVLRLQERPTALRAALVGAASGLAFLFTPYLGLLALVVVAVGGGLAIRRMNAPRDGPRIARLFGALLGTLALPLVPGAVAFLRERNAVAAAINSGLSSIANESASARSYLVPAPWSPFFGWVSRSIGPQHFASETVLFAGYSTLALALAALVTLVRRKDLRVSPTRANLVATAGLLVPAAALLSFPPRWHVDPLGLGTFTLPLPSLAIDAVTSYYRVYARIGYVAIIALAILAAHTLDKISRRRHGNVLVALLLAAIAIELLPATPKAWSLRTAPDYDAWLRRHPGGTVADYPSPIDTTVGIGITRAELDYQVLDGHPRYNFLDVTLTDTREGAIRAFSRDPDAAITPRILAAEHVRYVVIHDAAYRLAGKPQPRVIAGFRLVAGFPDARILAVDSRPLDLNAYVRAHVSALAAYEAYRDPRVAIGDTGFFGPEKYASDSAPRHWLGQNGVLDVANNGENTTRTRYRLSFFAFSAGAPRRVSVVLPDGRAVASSMVPTSDTSVSLGPFPMAPGTRRLTLRVEPGPAPLSASDSRVASIYLSPPQLTVIPNVTATLAGH